MRAIYSLVILKTKCDIRNRSYLFLLTISFLFIFSSFYLSEMMVGEQDRVVYNLSLLFCLFLGVYQTIFFNNIPLNDPALYMILSQPIERNTFIIASFLSKSLSLLVLVVLFFVQSFLIIKTLGYSWKNGMNVVYIFLYFQLLLLMSLYLFFFLTFK